jgi:hypothetical protein
MSETVRIEKSFLKDVFFACWNERARMLKRKQTFSVKMNIEKLNKAIDRIR